VRRRVRTAGFSAQQRRATQLAAVGDSGVADMDLAVWERTLQVNLTGTMLATQIALPHLIASGDGRIVNMSSGASLRGDLVIPPTRSRRAASTPSRSTRSPVRQGRNPLYAIAPGLVVTPASSGNFAGPLGDLMLRHHSRRGSATPKTSPQWWSFSAHGWRLHHWSGAQRRRRT